MSIPPDTPAAAADPAADMPPESVRTLVTLVLLFHLFIAAVAAIGSARAYSVLVDRLVDRLVVRLYYPDLLAMSSFSYLLTYNRTSDYEGTADVVLNWEDGDETRGEAVEAKEKLVFFDPAEIRLPIRRHRYVSYMRRMSELATMEPPSPLEVEMPTAVSKALLERAGMPEGRHRFRLRRLPTPPPQYDPDARTPPIANVYEGNISVRDGRVDLIKADRAAASSPVVPGATSNRPENAPRDGVPPLPPPSDEPLRGGVPLVPPNDNPARSDGNR